MGMNLEIYYKMVEKCISSLGVDPLICRGKEAGQWTLKKGSSTVWIDIWYIEKEKRSYIQIMSPVMEVKTTQTEAFYKELLEINDKLFGCGFTLYQNTAWLKSIRETDGLDENELLNMFNRVGNYADQYDDYLKSKYNPASVGAMAPPH
jgi:hypothetical protein